MVMPAYNASAMLARTVSEVPAIVDEIVVVDDQSTDDTVAVSNRLGLRTLVHAQNRGYGGNQKTCYKEALRIGADIVVMVHPDYQYTPKLILALAHCVASGLYDVGSSALEFSAAARCKAACLATSTSPIARSRRSRMDLVAEALRVPQRLPRVLSPLARDPAARGELRRLRVRQSDAGASHSLRLLDRRGHLPDQVLSGSVIDRLSEQCRDTASACCARRSNSA